MDANKKLEYIGTYPHTIESLDEVKKLMRLFKMVGKKIKIDFGLYKFDVYLY